MLRCCAALMKKKHVLVQFGRTPRVISPPPIFVWYPSVVPQLGLCAKFRPNRFIFGRVITQNTFVPLKVIAICALWAHSNIWVITIIKFITCTASSYDRHAALDAIKSVHENNVNLLENTLHRKLRQRRQYSNHQSTKAALVRNMWQNNLTLQILKQTITNYCCSTRDSEMAITDTMSQRYT